MKINMIIAFFIFMHSHICPNSVSTLPIMQHSYWQLGLGVLCFKKENKYPGFVHLHKYHLKQNNQSCRLITTY